MGEARHRELVEMNEDELHRELVELLSPFRDTPEEIRNIADELLVSIPTVQRWAEGTNLPERAMCLPIIEHLENRVPAGP